MASNSVDREEQIIQVQYSAVQYSTVQYSTVQYSTVQQIIQVMLHNSSHVLLDYCETVKKYKQKHVKSGQDRSSSFRTLKLFKLVCV